MLTKSSNGAEVYRDKQEGLRVLDSQFLSPSRVNHLEDANAVPSNMITTSTCSHLDLDF